MKSLLTLIATTSLIGSLAPTINNHPITSTPTNTTKKVSNLAWKFTKTNKNIQNFIHWNNTSGIFKESRTNKLFFINANGEIKDTNLYNANTNPVGFATTINNNYIIISGNKTDTSPFQYFLVNKDYKFVDLNSFETLKNVKIKNFQVIDTTHVIITDGFQNGFLLTINDGKIDVNKLNTIVYNAKKISNNLIAITDEILNLTIIYDIVSNKQIQAFDDFIFSDIKMFNDQKGVLSTPDLKTYWITNNNHVTLKLLDFESTSIDFFNNEIIIAGATWKAATHQININGSFSALQHSGDFYNQDNNWGIIFHHSQSYLISQNPITKQLNYTQIKINNLPLEYSFITKPVALNKNYLMFSTNKNGLYKSYVIDKNGTNIKNFPTNYVNLGAINNNTSIVFNIKTNESEILTTS